MADGTKIEWTDATVNAVNGCSVLSPGCKRCYAMKQAHRVSFRRDLVSATAGGQVWNGKVYLHEKALLEPLHWKKPRRIFWNAHGDLFHENVPDEWIDRVFAVCALTPQHTHQILTKRAERMREYLSQFEQRGWYVHSTTRAQVWADPRDKDRFLLLKEGQTWPLPNVWLGVSVEDQKRADERIPHLLETPAAVRFLSCEPLLGPVDIDAVQHPNEPWKCSALLPAFWLDPALENNRIDWVIVGGESGPGARPMQNEWAQSLVDQCKLAQVAVFVKQLSNGSRALHDIEQFPEELRVREFPNAA